MHKLQVSRGSTRRVKAGAAREFDALMERLQHVRAGRRYSREERIER